METQIADSTEADNTWYSKWCGSRKNACLKTLRGENVLDERCQSVQEALNIMRDANQDQRSIRKVVIKAGFPADMDVEKLCLADTKEKRKPFLGAMAAQLASTEATPFIV
jgi:hypothetical protein